jgi:hypothetical protein
VHVQRDPVAHADVLDDRDEVVYPLARLARIDEDRPPGARPVIVGIADHLRQLVPGDDRHRRSAGLRTR